MVAKNFLLFIIYLIFTYIYMKHSRKKGCHMRRTRKYRKRNKKSMKKRGGDTPTHKITQQQKRAEKARRQKRSPGFNYLPFGSSRSPSRSPSKRYRTRRHY